MEEMSQIIIPATVAVITAIISFAAGRADNKLNVRRELKRERFEKLYNPFVQLYDKTHMGAAYNFTDFSDEIKNQYVDLLVSNMVFANSITRDYIIQFMMIMSTIENDDSAREENIDYLNRTFNTICELMYMEWEYLSNKLLYSWGDRLRNKRMTKRFRSLARTKMYRKAFMNNL